MMINNMVNAALIVAGILQYLGMLGGLGFLVWYLVKLFRESRCSDQEQQHLCNSCANHDICAELMDNSLPELFCASWKKKKP